MVPRPSYHVTPWQNWCNDPNGLLFDGTYYHAFYQHFPDAHHWGPMHWGHARSRDLYHWEHLPIALFPTQEGYCFSGSAVFDKNNSSGLGTAENPPIILMYTLHPSDTIVENGKPEDDIGRNLRPAERQNIAYSTDGIHFRHYEHNPVIANYGKPDFRDPKVFWHEESMSWICVLAAGDHVAYYRSPNLIDWTHSGDFGPAENDIPGVWECPDLFPLSFEARTYWIQIVSFGTDDAHGRCVTAYFIGDFDGYSFTSHEITNHTRLLDQGFDNYAAVTFSGTKSPCMMGWAMNWGYAADTPTADFAAQLTAPRTLRLYRDKNQHLAVASQLVPLPTPAIETQRQLFITDNCLNATLNAKAYHLTFMADNQAPSFKLRLSNQAGEMLLIEQDSERILNFDRSQSGRLDFHPMLQNNFYLKRSLEPLTPQAGNFELLIDGPLIELFADDGTRVFTAVAYPESPYTRIRFEGSAGKFYLTELAEYTAAQSEDMYVNQVLQKD